MYICMLDGCSFVWVINFATVTLIARTCTKFMARHACQVFRKVHWLGQKKQFTFRIKFCKFKTFSRFGTRLWKIVWKHDSILSFPNFYECWYNVYQLWKCACSMYYPWLYSLRNFYAQNIIELPNQSIQLKKKNTKELSKKYLFNHENTYTTTSNWLFVHS